MRDPSLRRERRRESLWLLPAVVMTACVALALVLTELDRLLQRYEAGSALQRLLARSPQAADAILGVVAGSMLSLTVLVFSITVVVLQLSSSQYAAGSVRRFFRDRSTKFALGLFLGTFVFALVGLRSVRYGAPGRAQFVPGLVVLMSYALVFASVGVFLQYMHHVTQAIRAPNVVAGMAEETAEVIDCLDPLPEGLPPAEERRPELRGPPLVVAAHDPGHVVYVDTARLLAAAVASDVFIAAPALGEFVGRGEPVLRVWGTPTSPLAGLADAVRLATEPSIDRDVTFGLRQLADVGWRALSPTVGDPSVAHAVLDHMEDLLARLGGKRLGGSVVRDSSGRVRLLVERVTWEQCLDVALGDLATAAGNVPSVWRHFADLVDRLAAEVPHERASALKPYALH